MVSTIHYVLVPCDSGAWFVQALEIDYAAQGRTKEDALDRFTKGLALTSELRAALVKDCVEACPADVWADLTAEPGAVVETLSP